MPVVILGGGFAGLSCATALAEAGVQVTLLEKKPHLGGRAYSFRDPRTGEIVDNGQHLFMGCYRETRVFLRRIGTESLLQFPSEVRVDYADAQGRRDVLKCPGRLPAPLRLAWGVWGLSGLSFKDKINLWHLDRYMRRAIRNGNGSSKELDRMTVRQWLNQLGQSSRIQERLFDPIAIGALNEDPEIASAKGFVQVLREIFYRDAESSRLGLSTVGLSDLYTEQSRKFIESRGGRVLLNEKVSALVQDGGRLTGVSTERGGDFAAEAVVSTLPPWALQAVNCPGLLMDNLAAWRATPIIGINLWLEEPIIEESFIGLLGTEIHWVFNKTKLWNKPGPGQYLSLVISGAHKQAKYSPEELFELAQRDLTRCFPAFKRVKINNWSVIKEPYATPMPECGLDSMRPGHQSAIPNFYYAGDWTQTGLPATIESAVKSGHACAQLIMKESLAITGSR